MKLLSILLGLAATGALCSPTTSAVEATAEDCGELGVMEWDTANLPEGTDVSALRNPLYDPTSETEVANSSKRGELLDEVAALAKRGVCSKGGRGSGYDYDYGCDNGWCWRNCDGPFGNGGWTPCGRWQDCEWSYNNKAAKSIFVTHPRLRRGLRPGIFSSDSSPGTPSM
ncbi:victoriocin [Bipolaris maydis]|nr:victoriocin [Bipolaris maydis]